MIIIAIAIIIQNLGNSFEFLNLKPIVYANMLSVTFIDFIFLPATFFAIFNSYKTMKNFLKGLKEQHPPTEKGETLLVAIKGTLTIRLLVSTITKLPEIEFENIFSNKSN